MEMTTEESRMRLTDRKRAAILQAAANEFRSHGFDNTSMDGVAKAAAVSKRTVYNHFPSKEDLFAAIVDTLLSSCSILAEYEFEPDVPLETQLIAIAHSAMEMLASDDFQGLVRVVLSRFLQSPQLARTLVTESKHPEQGLIPWIQAAHESGRLEVTDPKLAAKQFVGLLDTFAFWPQIFGSEPPLTQQRKETIVKSTVDMFLSRYAT
jgi:TetR/AcrR family transcriptional regulator, regulator of autoinduction and epiphytic fitness